MLISLLLVVVISLSLLFLYIPRVTKFLHLRNPQCRQIFFLLFLTYSPSISSLQSKALHIIINFLVIWPICLTSSFVQIKKLFPKLKRIPNINFTSTIIFTSYVEITLYRREFSTHCSLDFQSETSFRRNMKRARKIPCSNYRFTSQKTKNKNKSPFNNKCTVCTSPNNDRQWSYLKKKQQKTKQNSDKTSAW